MKMIRTYRIKKSIHPAWIWDRYEKTIKKEWQFLLDNQSQFKEKDFQVFLERNPSFLPLPFLEGAHGLFPTAIISQPVLPGLQSKIPDFALLSRDSASFYANFIEIEDPNKPWATKSGQQSAQLTQAINQIKDWKIWFQDGNNKQKFINEYKIPQNLIDGRSFEQRYILIFGRNNDPTLTDTFKKKRNSLQNSDEVFMTYDRLLPNREFQNYMTVKINSNGYQAIYIPPTLRISPLNAQDWYIIVNKDNAVNSNTLLSKSRKQFLNSRWNYWDNWGKQKNYGIIYSKDYE